MAKNAKGTATVPRSRLQALTIETVIAISTAQINAGAGASWARIRNMWNSLLHGHGDRTACETELAWAMGYNIILENK